MTIMTEEEQLNAQLEALRTEHRKLDEAIARLQDAPLPDHLSIKRMKKRKLALKDQISRIEDQLYPDIIA